MLVLVILICLKNRDQTFLLKKQNYNNHPQIIIPRGEFSFEITKKFLIDKKVS